MVFQKFHTKKFILEYISYVLEILFRKLHFENSVLITLFRKYCPRNIRKLVPKSFRNL